MPFLSHVPFKMLAVFHPEGPADNVSRRRGERRENVTNIKMDVNGIYKTRSESAGRKGEKEKRREREKKRTFKYKEKEKLTGNKRKRGKKESASQLELLLFDEDRKAHTTGKEGRKEKKKKKNLSGNKRKRHKQ